VSLEVYHVRELRVLPQTQHIIGIAMTGDDFAKPLIPVDTAYLILSVYVQNFLARVAVPDNHFLTSSAFLTNFI